MLRPVCVPALVLALLSTSSILAQHRLRDSNGSRPGAPSASAPRIQSGPAVMSHQSPVQVHSRALVSTHFGHVPQHFRGPYHYGYYPGRFAYGPGYYGYGYPAYPSYAAAGYDMDGYSFPSISGAIGDSAEPLLPPPEPEDAAVIAVQLPANADLWIEGTRMRMAGAHRRFVSPPLEPGVTYVYEVRAVWNEKGHKVEQSQSLTVRAGNQSSIIFRALP